ncbi:MAG: hypothetical protein CMF38_02165 [Legionellaceae bacterium]|nr:hypothetical protein [Legionellaceae bacterium]HCA89132.1 hypothetical protein [Legionellales bacterium]|tara:strand:- start:1576 stop:1755 length:180 start_codon:yes stop_codon:yes gene_type:complete
MFGLFLRNLMRVKLASFIMKLILGKKNNLKGTTKLTILTFVVEQILSKLIDKKKSSGKR